ncbi:MAG: hypothetical protein NZ601_06960 [candidate division WOR-3 bacterium]|nr:hypothetical protein [candidate division WOR-3 bacterium]MCX7757858.1 hypothetical protein [candidate division WOR-3 bacterium]MDW7987892.1 hypothetical protein [candidate division WOR-3 bacterium]
MSSVKKEIVVSEVKTKKDLSDFINLPWKIYKNDPNWIPPLIDDIKETLSKEKNPFFQHADLKLFIARHNNEVVGRVAVIIDYNYCKYHDKNVAFFGFFETTYDYFVAEALMKNACEYAKSRNMKEIYGPANPSLNDEVGFLIEGFNSPPCIKMSYNPPYYLEFIEKLGFQKIKDLYSYYIDLTKPPPNKLLRVINSIKTRKEIVVRPVNLRKLKDELIKIKEIYNDAWSNNWDFAPMTDEEIDYLAKKLKPIVVPEIVQIAEVAGEPAGMSIGLPDYNQVLKHLNGKLFPFGFIKFLIYRSKINGARLWALGVKNKFRNIGIDALIYYETFIGGIKKGYKWGDVGWILEDNHNIINPILLWDAKLYKKYRIYHLIIS